jgi:pimeloyl-ACP methyl ester carboxylesterase
MGNEAKHRFQQALSELNIPTLLVRGTEDRICSAQLLRALFEIIKLGKLATIRGCDHFPMLEYTDEFASLLLNFFEQNSSLKPANALTKR